MLKATLGYKKITEDQDNFSLKGMIEPTFYNFGAETVWVLHSPVQPGESFLAGVSQMVMDNDVVIRFEGNDKRGRNLMVYYGEPVSNC